MWRRVLGGGRGSIRRVGKREWGRVSQRVFQAHIEITMRGSACRRCVGTHMCYASRSRIRTVALQRRLHFGSSRRTGPEFRRAGGLERRYVFLPPRFPPLLFSFCTRSTLLFLSPLYALSFLPGAKSNSVSNSPPPPSSFASPPPSSKSSPASYSSRTPLPDTLYHRSRRLRLRLQLGLRNRISEGRANVARERRWLSGQ